jgi:hypothetical protein
MPGDFRDSARYPRSARPACESKGFNIGAFGNDTHFFTALSITPPWRNSTAWYYRTEVKTNAN